MDGAAIAGWVVALGTLGLLWVAVRQNASTAKDQDAVKMNEIIKPLVEELARHERHHAKHFTASAAVAAGMATIGQQLIDHEHHDEERFNRIEAMHQEIRADIKELLKRASS